MVISWTMVVWPWRWPRLQKTTYWRSGLPIGLGSNAGLERTLRSSPTKCNDKNKISSELFSSQASADPSPKPRAPFRALLEHARAFRDRIPDAEQSVASNVLEPTDLHDCRLLKSSWLGLAAC